MSSPRDVDIQLPNPMERRQKKKRNDLSDCEIIEPPKKKQQQQPTITKHKKKNDSRWKVRTKIQIWWTKKKFFFVAVVVKRHDQWRFDYNRRRNSIRMNERSTAKKLSVSQQQQQQQRQKKRKEKTRKTGTERVHRLGNGSQNKWVVLVQGERRFTLCRSKKKINKNNKKRNEIKEKVWKACFFFFFFFFFFLWPWVGSEKYWMSTTVAEKELHSRRQTIREIRSGGMNGRRFLFFSAPLDDTTFLERAAGHARPFLERRTAETPKRNIKSKTTTTTKETGYFLIDFHYRRRRKRNLPELERNEFKSGSMKKK